MLSISALNTLLQGTPHKISSQEQQPCFALSKNDSYVMSASGGKISLFNMMTFKTMTQFMPPPSMPATTISNGSSDGFNGDLPSQVHAAGHPDISYSEAYNSPEKMQGLSTSSSRSEDAESPDSMICHRDVPSSMELPFEDELMDEVLEVHERIDGDAAKLSETGNSSPSPVETPEKVSQKVEDRVSDLQEIHATVRAKLEQTYAKYKAKADQQRRQQSFEVGDLVWVYLPRERYPQGAFTKLKPKKIGPCQVLEKFGDNAYRVELPDDVFISDVFNIRHLTPYAGENSSLRSSFSEDGESDEDIRSDQGPGQSNQSLDVPVPATQSQQATSGTPAPGSLRRSKRLQNKRA